MIRPWRERLRTLYPTEKWMLESPGCESRNFGDTVCARESKLRIDFGPGYRVYFAIDIDTVDMLFCGGDKTPCFEACAAREGRDQFLRDLPRRSIAISRILGQTSLHDRIERSNLKRRSRQVVLAVQ